MKKMMSLAVVCLCLQVTDLSLQMKADDKGVSTNISGNIQLPFELKTIKLSTGVTLEYAEQGDKNGIPVILLHGFTDSWKSFEAVMPHLPANMHVFSISQRGHGNSSKDATSYKPSDFAKDISDFIKQQQLSSAVIVGHSMGSTNAQCFATMYPNQTKALVLVGSFADFNKPVIEEFKKAIDGLIEPVDSSFAADFQNSTIVNPIPAEMLLGFINETRKLPVRVWKGVAAGWNEANYLEKLKTFSKPSLIIWGDKDAYCPKEDQVLLSKALSNSKLVVYKHTGHANHWEEPERFARDLTEFVNGLSN
jgi:non-heme chloroperoxidase